MTALKPLIYAIILSIICIVGMVIHIGEINESIITITSLAAIGICIDAIIMNIVEGD